MIIKLGDWIKNEVVEPAGILYGFLFKNIKTALFFLVIISTIIFSLFPNLIYPIEKNSVELINPSFEIKRGRMTSLILSQDNENRGRYRVNCAYFIDLNGDSYCDNLEGEEIVTLNGFYLERGLFENNSGLKNLVVNSFNVNGLYEFNVDESTKGEWSNKIVNVIYFIRLIFIFAYSLLAFIFIRKYIFNVR
jgi:hypothetical protein